MGSVNDEIARITGAKTDIKNAIEYCGVTVPTEYTIDRYDDQIMKIPVAVFSQFTLEQPVGGDDKYIKSVSQENGLVIADAGDTTSNVDDNSDALVTSRGVYTKVQEYLPLAGGTMKGQIKFAENTTTPHIVGDGNNLSLGASTNGSQLVLKEDAVRASTSNYDTITLGTDECPWKSIYSNGIIINGTDTDRAVLRFNNTKSTDASGTDNGVNRIGDYGFTFKYLGTGTGINNALGLYADNQTATTQTLATKWLNDGTMYSRAISPHADDVHSLGSTSAKWKHVYAYTLHGKIALSDNIIDSKSKDSVSNWGNLGTSIHYYNTSLENTLPSAYGLMLNVSKSNTEVHQLWMSQPGGTIYHRGGNGSGWYTNGISEPPYWRALLDNVNYTTYINETKFPGLKKVGTVTSITAGTGLTGGTITTSGTITLATSGVAANYYGPSSNVTGSNDTTMSVPYIKVDTYGRITEASNKTYTAKNYYPTTFSWKGGTTAGPTGSLTGTGMTAVSFGAIPAASGTASGIVTTGTQTFAGDKTFSGKMTVNNTITFGSSDSYGLRTATDNYVKIGESGKAFYQSYINTMYTNNIRVNATAGSIGESSKRFTYGYFSQSVRATNGFYEDSDERLKQILEPIKINLNDLSKLRKIYYLWKDNPEQGKQLGVIAQDIQKLYPELVDEDTETGLLSVAYDKLSVVALAAVDKLHEEISSLQKKNTELEDRISKLENLLLYGKGH